MPSNVLLVACSSMYKAYWFALMSAQRGKYIAICKEIVFNGGRSMTKEELQAKHRLEEAQARNRQQERKARTRRLIQEGAIL